MEVIQEELDGVGPIDNRPSSDKLHHIVKKKSDMWYVTCDTWHFTHDTWYVTRDMWHVQGWSCSQNFSPLAFTVCYLWYYEDSEEKADWLNQWMNDEAVYRTAPATQDLLKMLLWNIYKKKIQTLFSFLLLYFDILNNFSKMSTHIFFGLFFKETKSPKEQRYYQLLLDPKDLCTLE